MKNLLRLCFCLSFAVVFIQCQKDDITVTPVEEEVTVTDPGDTTSNSITGGDTTIISGDISADVTWTTGNTYFLDSLISVTGNATLTIEPGVVVKGRSGNTGLVITKGSKIDAIGTAEKPIIFTSELDELEPGDILSPNLTMSDKGLWGGVYILGCAPVSNRSGNLTEQFRLLPNRPNFQYGGDVANDNSGTLKYVSIRHCGAEVVTDETGNGLNLAGVGSGTTIDHLETMAALDDGLMTDGGTVSMSNVVIHHFGDDGIDCDRGWAGTIDNIISVGVKDNDAAMELDGGEGSNNPSFTIKNGSFKGESGGGIYIDFRQDVNCLIEDSYFFNFDAGAQVELDRDIDAGNWISGALDVAGLEFNTSHLSSGNTTIGQIFIDMGLDNNDAFSSRTPNASVVTSPTVGANKQVFSNWTVADLTDNLNDF